MVRIPKDMESRVDNTIVVIPAYNEARMIGGIVRDIVTMGMSVLVVDDGSVDSTERAALDNGAMVIRNKHNLGKGLSIRVGIKYVLEKTNFKWMVTMDADGQHHTEDLPVLMKATHAENVGMVIGNRMLQTKTMPPVRYWTNKFTSWMVSGVCKQDIPDTQCGYRLIRVNILKDLELISEQYDIESEMLIEAAENQIKIKAVPIQTIYGKETSTIKPIRDSLRFFNLIFRYHFNINGIRRTKKPNG